VEPGVPPLLIVEAPFDQVAVACAAAFSRAAAVVVEGRHARGCAPPASSRPSAPRQVEVGSWNGRAPVADWALPLPRVDDTVAEVGDALLALVQQALPEATVRLALAADGAWLTMDGVGRDRVERALTSIRDTPLGPASQAALSAQATAARARRTAVVGVAAREQARALVWRGSSSSTPVWAAPAGELSAVVRSRLFVERLRAGAPRQP
jgi:hypothetical protein